MATFTVSIQEENTKGAFVALDDNNQTAGNMTFSKAGTDKIIIDHTDVEEAYAGQGVGKVMFEAAIAYAKEKGLKIMPLCPFANSMFKKNPQYSDLLF